MLLGKEIGFWKGHQKHFSWIGISVSFNSGISLVPETISVFHSNERCRECLETPPSGITTTSSVTDSYTSIGISTCVSMGESIYVKVGDIHLLPMRLNIRI